MAGHMVIPGRIRLTAAERRRIRRHTRRVKGHTIWTGATAGKKGQYPYMKFRGRSVGVHRIVYEDKVDVIPFGWDVHHTCPFTLCIEAAHLQAVPPVAHRHGNRWRRERGHLAA